MSSLPIGIDLLLKEKLEVYRGDLPPALKEYEQLKGFVLYTGSDLNKMRNWKSNPMCMMDVNGNMIVGAFDDLLHNPETGELCFLDYKTKGKEPDQNYVEKYYQTQLNIYTRFLELGGKKVAPFGVFLYFWPVTSGSGLLDFQFKPFFLKPDTNAAEELFKDAIRCLSGPLPPANPNCEYCAFVAKRAEFL